METQPHDMTDRDIRQRELVTPESLAGLLVTIIGVGAIGRQVALQLAAMGVPRIRLIDPDKVGVENLSSQGWLEQDIDLPKVVAAEALMHRLNSTIDITMETSRFTTEHGAEMDDVDKNVVFVCVDDIEVREFIYRNAAYDLLVDMRMAAEVARVLTVAPFMMMADDAGEYYERTLFSTAEAYQEGCTAKSTIYCASFAAALAISQFTKFLRGMLPSQDIMFNMLSSELTLMLENEEASDGWADDDEEESDDEASDDEASDDDDDDDDDEDDDYDEYDEDEDEESTDESESEAVTEDAAPPVESPVI